MTTPLSSLEPEDNAGVVRVLIAMLILSAGYAYAQRSRDVFEGFGALRGEQGDPAEFAAAAVPPAPQHGANPPTTVVR